MAVPLLAGCMGSGLGLESNLPDDTITTATSRSEQKTVSDEITVRNAVTSADIGKMDKTALPWANSFTGSAGTVDQLSEITKDGVVCRDFMTTTHSYDGVSKYAGRTCLGADGQWRMVRFEKLG